MKEIFKQIKWWISTLKEIVLNQIVQDWKTFFIILLISVIYWFLTGINENYRFSYAVTVQYETEDGKKLPDSIFNDTLLVRTQSKMWQNLKRNIPRKIQVPAELYNNPDKKKYIESILTSQSDKWISFDRITWKKNPLTRSYGLKKVPVKLRYRLIPEVGFIIKSVSIDPDSVWIFGNNDHLNDIEYIPTITKKIEHLRNKKLLNPPLVFPSKVYGVTKKVRVKIHTPPYIVEEKEIYLTIPSQWKNKLILFPSKVRVYYKKYIENNSKNSKTDKNWKISIDTTEILKKDYLMPVVLEKPADVFDIRIEPEQIEYLIKQNE